MEIRLGAERRCSKRMTQRIPWSPLLKRTGKAVVYWQQRVSIARAFAKQPDIVLLDDCLSAVDTNTESKILGYLGQALADKTAIIITHRIYSMLQFDRIIVLDQHRIAEMGTHEELLAAGGYYTEMYEKQLSGEVAE